jgi:hypothetical protein
MELHAPTCGHNLLAATTARGIFMHTENSRFKSVPRPLQ